MVALITTVFAAPVERAVTAFFNNIRISINGTEFIPRDAAGNIVEPFLVDGTTYLPVRAVSEVFGMDVSWDGTTQTVHLNGAPRLQRPVSERYFEDSFVNTPLDPRWGREGGLTFQGENGLHVSRDALLTLEGFSLATTNNFTIEFDAIVIVEGFNVSLYEGPNAERSPAGPLFGISFGTDADGNQIDWIGTRQLSVAGSRTNTIVHGASRGNIFHTIMPDYDTVADFNYTGNNWYNIRIDVINNQAIIYVDNNLLASLNLSPRLNYQVAFGYTVGTTGSGPNIRNFKVTIND